MSENNVLSMDPSRIESCLGACYEHTAANIVILSIAAQRHRSRTYSITMSGVLGVVCIQFMGAFAHIIIMQVSGTFPRVVREAAVFHEGHQAIAWLSISNEES